MKSLLVSISSVNEAVSEREAKPGAGPVSKPATKIDIPSSPAERSLWVQMQLRLRGSSFAAIARKYGWAKTSVSMAMKTPSFPQEQAIAEELGLRIESLFPERFDAEGRRLHPIRKNSSRHGRGNVKGREVVA